MAAEEQAEVAVFHPQRFQKGRLPMGRIRPATAVRRELNVDVPAGTTPDEILDPDYFAHYARNDLTPNDLLEVTCEDGTWEGRYRVMYVGTAEVKVSPIYIVYHEVEQTEYSETYGTKFVSQSVKWAVYNKANGAIIKDHLQSEAEAYKYLRQHLMDMKR